MNWLDIVLIIIMILTLVGAIVCLVYCIHDEAVRWGIALFLLLIVCASLPLLSFIKIDKGSGSTIGTITSIDKNFFGTTAVYIKTSEVAQEKYCIEDERVVEQAKELIGKKVKVDYGTRVGLYSTGRCSSAPIEKIELLESNN